MSFQHVTLVSYVNFINKHEYRTLTVLCIAIGGYRATPPNMDSPPPFPPSTQNFWYFHNFSKFLFPTRNFTISLLKMDLNIYQKTTFALKMWSKTHIWTNLRFLCEIDQKVPIFVEKLKKMQHPKMTFRSQSEPSIKSCVFYVFAKFRIGNHPGLMDSWKSY